MTARPAAEIGRAIDRRFTQLGQDVRGVVVVANGEAARLVQASVASFLGGRSIRLRGVGRSGARVGVQAVVGTAGGREGAIVRMTGPAHLVERDTPPHLVGTGATGDSHSMVMAMPDGRRVNGPFMAGGSTGREPFGKGVASARPAVPRVYRRGVHTAIVRAARG